jgi:DNA-binding transcriptional LysR family regulator
MFHETAVVAMPARHRLARRKRLSVAALRDEPLIVPDRRTRPHSHDLTIKLFARAGLRPAIAQVAEEKQTIISLVAAGLGVAIVPRWTSRIAVPGVRFVPLDVRVRGGLDILPLAAAWMRGARDPARDAMLQLLRVRMAAYAAEA